MYLLEVCLDLRAKGRTQARLNFVCGPTYPPASSCSYWRLKTSSSAGLSALIKNEVETTSKSNWSMFTFPHLLRLYRSLAHDFEFASISYTNMADYHPC